MYVFMYLSRYTVLKFGTYFGPLGMPVAILFCIYHTLTDIVSQIRGNISRAESDLGDAHSNVNNLEGQLKDSVQTLKKELKK